MVNEMVFLIYSENLLSFSTGWSSLFAREKKGCEKNGFVMATTADAAVCLLYHIYCSITTAACYNFIFLLLVFCLACTIVPHCVCESTFIVRTNQYNGTGVYRVYAVYCCWHKGRSFLYMAHAESCGGVLCWYKISYIHTDTHKRIYRRSLFRVYGLKQKAIKLCFWQT